MLNGWLWCDRSRKHCQDFTCSSFTKSFCICINLWRYILPYLESIFYSMSLSILSILCWSFLDMLDSLQYVVWTLLRRSLRFCWRQSIECSFRFPTRRLAQIRRCPLWNLLWGWKHMGVICVLIALATWLAVKPSSCKNALPPVNMWRCWERSRWFHRMRSRRHFHVSGLVGFFNLWFDWFKIQDWRFSAQKCDGRARSQIRPQP